MNPDLSDMDIRLRIPANLPFLSLAMEFVRQGAQGFGFGQEEDDSLTLAAEEIVGYVMNLQKPSDTIELSMRDGFWRLTLNIDCSAANIDLRAFNLTWRMGQDEKSLEQMGLLIASRMVDCMTISSPRDRLHLCLTKHRSYPSQPAQAPLDPLPDVIERFDLIPSPSTEAFRYAVLQLGAARMKGLPSFLRMPALAADMHTAGDLEATLVCAPNGSLLAVACRNWLSPRCMEFFGPYLLTDAPIAESIRTELVEDCLIRTARTGALALICRHTPIPFTARFFDTLGSIPETGPDGNSIDQPVYYRLLREDEGTTVYVDPGMKDFLEEQYDRLALPRLLLQVPDLGTRIPPHSVLSVEFVREASRATLRLQRTGMDLRDNLRAHVRVLRQEGIRNILLELDLGKTEESVHASQILAAGFHPRLIIPDGGQRDLVLFTVEPPAGK